jgi:hypothetical protein
MFGENQKICVYCGYDSRVTPHTPHPCLEKIKRFVYIADTTVVLPLTPLTHVWRKSKDLYHLVLLYNIHFKIISLCTLFYQTV